MKIWKYYLQESKNYYPKEFYLLKDRFDEIRRGVIRLYKSGEHDRLDSDAENDFYHLITDFVDTLTDPHVFSPGGSFRRTIIMDDFVMKFAHSIGGVLQNEKEVQICNNSKYSDLFPKVYEVDKQFFWILMERVKPANYFSDLPINSDLEDVLYYYQAYSNTTVERTWSMLNWALVEILRSGKINRETVQNFVDEIVLDEEKTVGHMRFSEFIDRNSIYKLFASQAIKNLRIGFHQFYGALKLRKDLYEAMWYLMENYKDVAESDPFTSRLLQLGIENPEIELWDIRTGNIGLRSDGEPVVFDSSLGLTPAILGKE